MTFQASPDTKAQIEVEFCDKSTEIRSYAATRFDHLKAISFYEEIQHRGQNPTDLGPRLEFPHPIALIYTQEGCAAHAEQYTCACAKENRVAS